MELSLRDSTAGWLFSVFERFKLSTQVPMFVDTRVRRCRYRMTSSITPRSRPESPNES